MRVSFSTSTPKLDALTQALGPSGRADLNTAAVYSLWAAAREHMRAYAQTHHAGADNIEGGPATRTGHLEEAAEAMGWSARAEGGYIDVAAAGIGRVFRDLHIVPVKAKELTIPIHAIAYGRRVAEVRRSHAVFRPKGTNILATKDEAGNLVALYALCRRATVPQDRTILPDDDELTRSARRGVLELVRRVKEKAS